MPNLRVASIRERLDGEADVSRRNVEVPVIVSLLVLSLLVIGTYVVQQRGSAERPADARVIATAADQVTLTQRAAFLTARIVTATSAASQRRDRAALRSTAQAMLADHEVLTQRPEALGAGPAPEAVRSLRKDLRLDERVRQFIDAATRVAGQGNPQPTSLPARRVSAAARGPLRRDLARTARLYESESVRGAERLTWSLFVGTGLIVIGIIVLGALIFWPLARRMRQEMSTVALLEEIAVAANSARTIDEAYAVCLKLVCEHLGWPAANVYMPDPRDGSARPTDVWYLSDRSRYGAFMETARRTPLPKGVGLPGRVIVSGRAAWLSDMSQHQGMQVGAQSGQAVAAGLVGAVAFPVVVDDDVVGVVAAYSTRTLRATAQHVRILSQVGPQLARVIERNKHQMDLAHRALHDDVTGLPNRALLLEHLAGAQLRARRSGEVLALLLLDLDNFKLTNDALGHEIGDRMLAAVGQRLATGMRDTDIVARFGGDEFGILCEGLKDESEADELARHVHFLLRQQVSVDDRWMSASASIGVAIGRGGEAAEDLLRDADTAMYAAKRKARGTTARFDASMREEISERLRLADELVGAAQRGELRLHLQPIVDLENNRLRAFEALVRWQHPVQGMVPPGVFIPLAEDSGIIGEIGTWVLRESARWAARIHPGVYLSVNLSTRQLEDPMICDTVRDALQEFDVPAGRLTLEITESVLLDGEAAQLARLEALRATGARISLDDFGTGYSSLSYLQDLPLDVLKLDMSFAKRLIDGDDPHASSIIRAVASLADGLELDFVVEGIETAEQLARLRLLGCPLGQGYLFAKPMPAAEAIAFASAGRPDDASEQQAA